MYIKTVIPQRSEHLMSYLARTSIVNRFSSMSELFTRSGLAEYNGDISSEEFVYSISTLEKLANWIGLDGQALSDLIPVSKEGICSYLGLQLPEEVLCFDHVRCCPKCLKERGVIAAYFALRPMCLCIRHRCPLLENWEDGGIIRWNDNHLYERICDGEANSRSINDDEEELSIHLVRLLQGRFTSYLSKDFGLMDTPNFLVILLFVFKHSFRNEFSADRDFWAECYQKVRHNPLSIFEFISVLNDAGMVVTFRNFVAIYPDMYRDLYRGNFNSSYGYMKLQTLLEKSLHGVMHD